MVARPQLLEALRLLELLGWHHLRHHSADRRFDVDGRVMALLREPARQYEVPIEHTTRRVGDGILLIIAFGQHGVERGDRAAAGLGVTGTLDQLGQPGEHRRWIALGRRRFTDGQGDLALRLGIARQRVHQQQDVLALVTEVFGDACAVLRGAQAHQRRIVRRRGHHH